MRTVGETYLHTALHDECRLELYGTITPAEFAHWVWWHLSATDHDANVEDEVDRQAMVVFSPVVFPEFWGR